MRDNKSKLIIVWVPGNHGAGGSTIANAVGIALQHFTDKKTLIVNYGSPQSYMERYLEKDVDMRFSMDYLKSFDDSINAEHIKTYATSINEMLYIIPNSKISRDISMVGEDFNRKFLDEAKKVFDFIIVDIESGINAEKQMFLDKADIILAVMTSNEIMLDDLYGSNSNYTVRSFLGDKKTLCVFNLLDHGENVEKELNHLNRKYKLKGSFGITYDNKAYKACCEDKKFYSFMKKHLNMKKGDATLPEQIKELCGIITERLYLPMDESEDNHSFFNMLLSKTKHWGDFDA